MANGTSHGIEFPACRKRRGAACFDGGEVASNGSVLLLRDADRRLGLTAAVARRLSDGHQRGKHCSPGLLAVGSSTMLSFWTGNSLIRLM